MSSFRRSISRYCKALQYFGNRDGANGVGGARQAADVRDTHSPFFRGFIFDGQH